MIRGLDDRELTWVTEESNQRFLKELSPDFQNAIDNQNKEGVYDHLDDKIEKEMNAAEIEAIPKGTRYITNSHVKKFKDFLKSKGLSGNIESMPVTFLANYLRYFYYTFSCKDG